MRWKVQLLDRRGQRQSDQVGAVRVSDIVLEHDPWPKPTLFTSAAVKRHHVDVADPNLAVLLAIHVFHGKYLSCLTSSEAYHKLS